MPSRLNEQVRDTLRLQPLGLWSAEGRDSPNSPPNPPGRGEFFGGSAICADSRGMLLLGDEGIYCVRPLSWRDPLGAIPARDPGARSRRAITARYLGCISRRVVRAHGPRARGAAIRRRAVVELRPRATWNVRRRRAEGGELCDCDVVITRLRCDYDVVTACSQAIGERVGEMVIEYARDAMPRADGPPRTAGAQALAPTPMRPRRGLDAACVGARRRLRARALMRRWRYGGSTHSSLRCARCSVTDSRLTYDLLTRSLTACPRSWRPRAARRRRCLAG